MVKVKCCIFFSAEFIIILSFDLRSQVNPCDIMNEVCIIHVYVLLFIEPPPQPKPEIPPEPEEEDEYIPSTRARRSRGGSKRQSRSSTRRNPKRQKVEVPQVYREPTPSPPAPAAPPPDANFHLKYTYGVNAFKHWVIQKNSQIEQTSRPGQGKALKTFKTDILQSTADELNYALCLFVKEVRKPNGEEYAVDSIYYLCLGIVS